MDITPILSNAASSDMMVRTPAEAQLKQLEQQNWPAYLSALCSVLADRSKVPVARQLAGLILKNAIVSKDESIQQELSQRWSLLEITVRQQIQHLLLQTLNDPLKDVRSTAAIVIGKVAAVEIPSNSWPNLIEQLVNCIVDANTSPDAKQASFEALGMVCEECSHYLQNKSTIILNAIARGMFKDQTNNAIKLAATVALSNSLEFIRSNFEQETDRNQIMTMVFQATQSEDKLVRVAAYSNLVEIATCYYDLLPAYMKDIFMLTGNAIQNEAEEVALQAIEFWATVCEVEKNRIEEAEEAQERDQQLQAVCHQFARGALPTLLPLLLNCLTKQSEEIDDDTWNCAMAAGTCLTLFAQAVRDEIVGPVLQFVERNISNPNWRFREAATLAFGSILDGPSKAGLTPLVTRAFDLILSFLRDPQPHVKDTAAWTIGRICDVLPDTITEDLLPKLMTALLQSLDEQPKVASHVCWAIHNLAEAVYVDSEDPTSPLSKYFEGLVGKLLEVSQRQDAIETNLLSSAYEAINSMVANASRDCLPIVERILPVLKQRLLATLMIQGLSGEERDHQMEAQGLLCGALQSIVTKVDPNVVEAHADEMMQYFLQVLNAKNSTVHEEALMAIGALANQLESKFVKYMGHFKPFLINSLRNFKEYQECIVAIGVVGDICRALEGNILAFCDDIMQLLLQNLQHTQVDQRVKPHIISCIGDVALATGSRFDRYLPFAMMMLTSLSQTVLLEAERSMENVEQLSILRASILEAYTGIVQGLSSGNKSGAFLQFMPSTMAFLDLLAKDQNQDEIVLHNAAGLIGDLASSMGPQSAQYLSIQPVKTLLDLAQQASENKTRERGEWALRLVQEVV